MPLLHLPRWANLSDYKSEHGMSHHSEIALVWWQMARRSKCYCLEDIILHNEGLPEDVEGAKALGYCETSPFESQVSIEPIE